MTCCRVYGKHDMIIENLPRYNVIAYKENRRREGKIMRFRPCIDIHNGKVKQIVGGSLQDQGDQAQENYVAEQDAPLFLHGSISPGGFGEGILFC